MSGAVRGGSRGGRWPIALGTLAAIAIAACVTVLFVDYRIERARAAESQRIVEALEEQARADARIAEELHAERERQATRLLRRKGRAERIAWVLVVAGGVLVGCGKSRYARRPPAVPSLDLQRARRFPSPSRRTRTARGAARGTAREAEGAGIDLSFVDEQVRALGRGREVAIPLLQAIQNHYRYLPDEALRRVCELTEITPAQIAGTSSFYARFRRSPVGRHVVRVCHGTACHVAGADPITAELRRYLGIRDGEDTDEARRFTVDRVACVGCCSLAPVMMIEEETAGRLTPAGARRVLDEWEERS